MRLLNVLIVDDEPFVVDWLSGLFETHTELALEIFRSYNASEAIEKLDRIRIDIMIADIKMPDMDGLKLAQIAIHNWSTCKVILLTAHADFTYVHNALNQGIFSYILKTETDEYILSELRRAIGAIEQEITQMILLEDLQRDRDAYQYQLKQYAFFNWLQNENEHSIIKKYIEVLGFSGENEHFCLLVGEINIENPASVPVEDNILFQTKVVILRYLGEYLAHYAMEPEKHCILWILQPKPDCIHRFPNLLCGLLEPVQQFFLENYHIAISFLFCEVTSIPYDITTAYNASKELLKRMHVNKSGYIYKYSIAEAHNIIEGDENSSFLLRTVPHIKQLKASLENGQYTKCRTALARICTGLRTCNDLGNSNALETYISTVLVFLHDINYRKQCANDIYQLLQPWKHSDWASACSYLERLSDKLFDLQESDKQQNINNIINTVEKYINKHICEDISLTVLSDVVGYNASYLSRFYSEKTGNTISDYIAKEKLRLIDYLMSKEPNLSLNQIAEQAGFRSRTYFNNYIKRITNLSPQKYRENLKGKTKVAVEVP